MNADASAIDLTKLYSKINGLQSMQVPRLSDPERQHILELESKHLLRASLAIDGEVWTDQSVRLLKGMKRRGVLLGQAWQRRIVTTYFDRWIPEKNIYLLDAQGKALRVRAETDASGQIYRADISHKIRLRNQWGVPVNYEFEGPLRIYATASGNHIIELTFDSLDRIYRDSPEWQAARETIPLDFNAYREIGTVECDRINHKQGLVFEGDPDRGGRIIPQAKAEKVLGLRRPPFSYRDDEFIGADIKRMVTELGIDRSNFSFPKEPDKQLFDAEAENEAKFGELDEYDPKPRVSSEDLSESQIAGGVKDLDSGLLEQITEQNFVSSKNDPEAAPSKRRRMLMAGEKLGVEPMTMDDPLTFWGQASRVILAEDNPSVNRHFYPVTTYPQVRSVRISQLRVA